MTEPKTTELTQLDHFLSPALLIPIKGTVYRVEALSAEAGLKLQKSMAKAIEEIQTGKQPDDVELASDDDEEDYSRSVLGDTYQQMLDGGVPAVAFKHVVAMVTLWTFSGFDAAQEYFRAGGKVQAPNRAARRRTATQTRTAAASTKTASRTGTSTQKATAKAAAGPKSSATGTRSKQTSKTKASTPAPASSGNGPGAGSPSESKDS